MSSLLLKRSIAACWPADQSSSRCIILLYHSIGGGLWGLKKKNFIDHVSWLADNCNLVSLDQLLTVPNTERISVALTFDDGYVSLFNEVAEVLEHNKTSATVYLNTGWISDSQESRRASDPSLGHYPDENFLSWDEIRYLKKSGWIIGSHGVNHHNFAELHADLASSELIKSRITIEDNIGDVCEHFAYPWGRYTPGLKEIVNKSGYKFAAAACHGKLNNITDLLSFPRINIAKNYNFSDFKNIVNGKWDFLAYFHKWKGL